jgi:hypothetical protein
MDSSWLQINSISLYCTIFALYKTIARRIYFYEWSGYAVNGVEITFLSHFGEGS